MTVVVYSIAVTEIYHHVASDIGVHQLFLPSANVCSQSYINNVSEWTQSNKMELNERKSKVMIFNFTRNQFDTRIHLNDTLLETATETSLLGTIVSLDLNWHKNS